MAETDSYFESKQFKDILKRYEDAQAAGTDAYFDSSELTDLAEYYYNNGKRAKATDLLDEAIATFPGVALPLVLRARTALSDERDVEKARYYASQVSDRLDLDYLYLEAEIMLTEHRDQEADQFLREKMDQIDEDDIPDYILDVATLFTDYNNTELAQTWLDLSDESDLGDYQELEGRIAFGKGNYEKSEQIFEQLLDKDPYSGRLWNSLASAQFMRERIDESISSSEFSIAINPNDADALLNKANGLFRIGQYEKALDYYRRFTAICPDDECGYLYQGNALLSLDQPQEALKQFQLAESKLSADSQNQQELYQNLAFTLSILSRVDEALEYLDKAETTTGSNLNEIMVMRGHIYLENNFTTEAQHCFATALGGSNHSPDIFLKVSISIYECGYTSIAYKMLKMLFDDSTEAPKDGYSYIAICSKQLNKRQDFLRYLKKACENNPYEARLVMGDLFPADLQPQQYYAYALEHNI